MYKQNPISDTRLEINTSIEGDTIEIQIEKMIENNEPIDSKKPLIFQERKEGVNRAYNPRTDRFEVAIEAMDKVSKSYIARREQRMMNEKTKTIEEQNNTEEING